MCVCHLNNWQCELDGLHNTVPGEPHAIQKWERSELGEARGCRGPAKSNAGCGRLWYSAVSCHQQQQQHNHRHTCAVNKKKSLSAGSRWKTLTGCRRILGRSTMSKSHTTAAPTESVLSSWPPGMIPRQVTLAVSSRVFHRGSKSQLVVQHMAKVCQQCPTFGLVHDAVLLWTIHNGALATLSNNPSVRRETQQERGHKRVRQRRCEL